MDTISALVDGISLLSLVLVSILGWRTLRAFRQSKQAVIESASLISVIVDALTARMQHAESATHKLRSEMNTVSYRAGNIEEAQAEIRKSHDRLLNQIQDAFANDRKLIAELEQLKIRLSTIQQRKATGAEPLPKRENLGTGVTDGDILAAVTSTEQEVLEILRLEGPKGAPELGIRLTKSREHMSRLMKKLYMEGYVDRETNHAPFRYKLNESLRSALESDVSSVTTKAPETL
jgi:chromosome segregation ATPase